MADRGNSSSSERRRDHGVTGENCHYDTVEQTDDALVPHVVEYIMEEYFEVVRLIPQMGIHCSLEEMVDALVASITASSAAHTGHGTERGRDLSIQTVGLSRRPRAQGGQSGSLQGVRDRAGLEGCLLGATRSQELGIVKKIPEEIKDTP